MDALGDSAVDARLAPTWADSAAQKQAFRQLADARDGATVLDVYRLGRQAYEPVWRAMQSFTDARGPETRDELWLVEHDPVFTLGQAGRPEHVLAPGDIPVVPVDRGGQVTYHGPGQIVAYPLLDLRRLGIGARELVRRMEQAIIDTLETWNIVAVRRDGAPGVYVGEAKVAALGLRIRRGCSFHGLAFNVAMDLEPFRRINPCGYSGLAIGQVIDLGGPGSIVAVEDVLVDELARQFGLVPVATATFPQALTGASLTGACLSGAPASVEPIA